MSLRLGECGRCFYNPIEFLESLSRTSIRVDEFWVSTGEFPRVSTTYLLRVVECSLDPVKFSCCRHVIVYLWTNPVLSLPLFRCLCILVVWTNHPWILLRVAGTLVRADELGFRICVRGAIPSLLIGQ